MKVPSWEISGAISEEEDNYNPSFKSNTNSFGKGMIETTFYDDFSSNNNSNSNNNNSANNNHYTLFVNGTVQVPTFTATTMNHPNNMNQLKRKMTLDLDFASGGGVSGIDLSSPSGLSNKLSVIKRSKVIQGLQTPQRLEILQSPDLHMLKLASPELEKLIIANSQGQITTTPTPNQIFFPKNVTEEQEFYAKGFVEALEKMKQENTGPTATQQNNHQIQPPSLASTIPISNVTLTAVNHNITDTNSSSSDSDENSNSNSLMTDESSNYQSSSTTATTNSGQIYYTNYYNSSPATTTSTALLPISISSAVPPESVMPQPNIMIKEEPQVQSHNNNTATSSVYSISPPMSPIDMANQEQIKLERKRQRNRVAASKCRRRKLERISKLEDKVKQLNCENSELLTVLAKLRETVEGLKQQVLEHCNAGCQISLLNTSISTSSF